LAAGAVEGAADGAVLGAATGAVVGLAAAAAVGAVVGAGGAAVWHALTLNAAARARTLKRHAVWSGRTVENLPLS
jgi:hypothetical protein